MSTPSPDRMYLSPPHLGDDEFRFVQEAFATNWVAPVGPHVDAFEREDHGRGRRREGPSRA